MARTKHTAKKTTGAPAPRLALASLHAQSFAKSSASRQPNRMTGMIKSSGNNTNGKRLENNFCSGCRNGGLMYMCDHCPRSFCNLCIIIPSTHPEDADFTCPHCHIFSGVNGQRAKKPSPYPFIIVGGVPQRELFPICDEAPLVVMSIRLASIPLDGFPAIMAYQHLHTYLPNAIAFYDLPFDLSTAKGVKQYRILIEQLVTDLTVGSLTQFKRFSIYVSDHTDPARGDLHFSPDGQGATTVHELMDVLIPTSLKHIMHDRTTASNPTNTLTFLACGSIVLCDESQANLRKLSASGLFAWVMAFGGGNFQPSFSNLFVAEVALYWHIQHRNPVNVVHDHQALGAHTDVYMFYPDGSACRLLWSHPGRRPFGNPTPIQCPNVDCRCLSPWGKPEHIMKGDEVVQFNLHCRNCGKKLNFFKENSMKMIKGTKITESERGDWYLQTI